MASNRSTRIAAAMERPTQIAGEPAVVAGLFLDADGAEQAIRELEASGFSSNDIGVAARDRTEQGHLIEESGTHVAEGALSGAVGGGLLGGLMGLLVGMGALGIPGMGPVVAGGALAAALGAIAGSAVAGAGIGAAAGGVVGALVGLGIPEDDARHFELGFQSGGVLVTVRSGGRAGEARHILEKHAADTGSRAASAPGVVTGADYTGPPASPAAAP